MKEIGVLGIAGGHQLLVVLVGDGLPGREEHDENDQRDDQLVPPNVVAEDAEEAANGLCFSLLPHPLTA